MESVIQSLSKPPHMSGKAFRSELHASSRKRQEHLLVPGSKALKFILQAVLLLLVMVDYTSLKAQAGFNDGPGGPILVVSSPTNPFSRYYVEILRAQGLNEFAVKDLSVVTSADLVNYDVVILGEMALTAANVTVFTNWVNAGGTLISMRPDAQLLPLLGLTAVAGTLGDKYLQVNTATTQGKGITGVTIQYHGLANLYTLSGATSLATLYSTATTATVNPAITIRDVGTNGGQAIAFAYDLARSVVYTRQGNPAWAGLERDGVTPIRSDDLFFGAAAGDSKPDWVDLNKVAIPQADEQQHLLTNIVIKGNADKKPLPKFWFLPSGVKAAVVMTGDDHASGGTAGRFDQYKAMSNDNSPLGVKNWNAIRGSSYIFPATPLTNTQAIAYEADNFDISVHTHTDCADWTPISLNNYYDDQIQQWTARFPGLHTPTTHRIHCLVWSDWVSLPKMELTKGIRLDVNYYYWPGTWVQNRSGMFTGSGLPMRYADLNGTLIDCFQVTTQMTDESDQSFPDFIDGLLDNATGTLGYYGVFCANMHTDNVASTGSDAIINSAATHNVPVVSAKQMLTWLDGRNSSTFNAISWSGNTLTFSITASAAAANLQAMLPMEIKASRLSSVTLNGAPVTIRTETIKGTDYAFFPALTGNYQGIYNGVLCTSPTATLALSPADCQGQSIGLKLSAATGVSPYSVMVNGQTYSNAIVGTNFTTLSTEESIWGITGTPQNLNLNDGSAIQVGTKFRTTQNGTVTGVRFYKGSANSGVHTGNLWNTAGTKLATAVFSSETASGWQEVRFATPVAVTANTTYVVSYVSASGGYANTPGLFTSSGVTKNHLQALQTGVDGLNGVYIYGTGYPNQSFNNSCYWVDVLYKPDSYTFTITSLTTAAGCNSTGVVSSATITQASIQGGIQTFYRDVDGDGYGNAAATQTGCTAPAGYIAQAGDCNDSDAAIHPGAPEICDGKDNNCDGRIDEGCTIYYRDLDNDGYGNPASSTTGTTPPAGYVANNTDCNDNNASVHPGAVEICGNGIDDNCNGTVDEGCAGAVEQSIWGNTGSPLVPLDFDGTAIEVGVKFRSSQAGSITGIRFYKGAGNTGTHTGNLWTITGTKLATIVFTVETASGWQVAHFTTPVSITANTVYVASYFSPSGKYASSDGYFTNSGVTSGPLTALAAGVSGANGVYRYTTTGFPTLSYNSANYWVDVLFKGNAAKVAGVAGTDVITSIIPGFSDKPAYEPLTVKVFPNYTASQFKLVTKGSGTAPLEIKVFDVAGRIVEGKRRIAPNSTTTLGAGFLPGTYYAEVIQGTEKVTVKMVKVSR
jgi:hypothetical protein